MPGRTFGTFCALPKYSTKKKKKKEDSWCVKEALYILKHSLISVLNKKQSIIKIQQENLESQGNSVIFLKVENVNFLIHNYQTFLSVKF